MKFWVFLYQESRGLTLHSVHICFPTLYGVIKHMQHHRWSLYLLKAVPTCLDTPYLSFPLWWVLLKAILLLMREKGGFYGLAGGCLDSTNSPSAWWVPVWCCANPALPQLSGPLRALQCGRVCGSFIFLREKTLLLSLLTLVMLFWISCCCSALELQ